MSTTLLSTMISTSTTWSSVVDAEEANNRARIFRLSPAAWKAEATRLIRTTRPNRMQETLAFLRSMDEFRANPPLPPTSPVMPEPRTAEDVDWKLWQDMVEEPAKYGDDIVQWLELDEKLRAGPKRWRVAAYWLQKEQEELALQAPYKELYSQIAKEAAVVGMKKWIDGDIKRFLHRIRNAAVTIQAAVRGHLVRSKSEYLNCCMCLAHTICPLRTHHGMMCRKCAEQGPYEDTTGPVTDPWNWSRADYVDLTAKYSCTDCGKSLDLVYVGPWNRARVHPDCWYQRVCREEDHEEMERCQGCGVQEREGSMDYSPGYGYYCSRRCGPFSCYWD